MSETSATEEDCNNNYKTKQQQQQQYSVPRTREFYSGVTHPHHSSIDVASSCAFMDLDFGELDASWSFDQIPASPFLVSTSDQPFSPLWAFADAGQFSDERKPLSGGVAGDFSRFSPTCNQVPVGENRRGNGHVNGGNDDDDEDNKKKLPAPFAGITSLDSLDVSYLIKERMTQALRYFKESTEQHQILAQVWAPVRSGNRYVLTTSGQPFVLGPHSNGLNQYRTVSLMYMFAVDGESDVTLGLPGRVFRQKLPEWTPDVQYYSSKEYSRVDHAKHYNVRGTLALPVFEPSGQSCVGVLELIMTSQKINYAPEVDKVCKALESVNLRSSEILDHPNIQICNEGRQNALAEILEVFTEVCETYKLPLAQTWIPCRHRSILAYGGGLKKTCSSFDGSCMGRVCMSTTDAAFYVVDAHMWGFREACAEHHLQKGQGVVGRAFSSHGLSFCRDISQFCKIDYPLVHYARMFSLRGSFAICLRSKHTGDDDYVLEFFLPLSMTDIVEQLNLVNSIIATMKQDLQNLMVASGNSLEEERKHLEIVEVPIDGNQKIQVEPNLPTRTLAVVETINGVLPLINNSQSQSVMEIDPSKNVAGAKGSQNGVCKAEKKETKKTSERKRGKAEKQISLEVLQQYFAGSLKDAAKSLGVCPTTMKRICRQHGISRWPSRKINKVNRSLTKLKRVIESVQGADGTFSLSSLAQPTMPVPVGSIYWPAGVNGTPQQLSPISNPTDLPDERSEMPSSKPRTDGQTSGASSSHEERNHEQNGFASKAGSASREVSAGTSTSHGSCHGSPGTESTPPNGNYIPSFHEPAGNTAGNSTGLMFRQNEELHLSSAFPTTAALLGPRPQEAFGGILLQDAGSSKDLRNLCPSAADCNVDEATTELTWINPPCPIPSPRVATSAAGASRFSARQDTRTITIKATFLEDIIRFRFSLTSNIVELKEEVAKRFKLEVGTFEIKYLDDDHEWVLIACDSDLQECLDISKSSGSNMIRLMIQDILGNLGSSCESSG